MATKESRTEIQAIEHALAAYREETRVQTDALIETQRSLEQSRDRYLDLYDFAPIGYVTLDPAGIIREINLTAAEMLGVQRGPLTGMPLQMFVLEADRPALLEHLRRCRRESGCVTSQLRLQCRTGRVMPVQLDSRSGVLDANDGIGFRTAITDLTERRQAEQLLREGREWLKLAQEAAGAGAWDWDLSTGKLKWSEGLYEIFGLVPGAVEPTYEDFLSRVHPDDRQRVRNSRLAPGDLRDVRLEFRIVLPDGQVRWLSFRGKSLPDGQNAGDRVIGVVIDISHIKQAEQRLQELNVALQERTAEAERRAEQLRSLSSQLTQVEQRERRRLAEILHDHLQQLLVGVSLQVSSLRQRSVHHEKLHRSLTQLEALMREAIDATRSLSVELSPPILYDGGLALALEWLGRRMQAQHGLHVEVDADPGANPTADEISVLLFHNVRELLFNVVKHAGVREARLSMAPAPHDRILIVVDDKGAGFDPTAISDDQAGTGLGLFGIQERLEMLGGNLEIETAAGLGTRVHLDAPREVRVKRPAAKAQAAAPPEPAGVATAGDERPAGVIHVLLADDHKLVRQGLTSMLQGHADLEVVGEAADGEAALELARRVRPDVVLMDVSMPRLNGIEATRRLAAELPGVRVIGLSMHESQDMAHAMREAGACAYISKDAPTEDLLAAIRAARAVGTSRIR